MSAGSMRRSLAAWDRDVAPALRRSLPETGLGRGWESPAILAVVVILLLFGLLTLYSASSVMAQRDGLPHYYYVARQGAGVAFGLLVLVACSRTPVAWWRRMAVPMMAASTVLLILLVLPFTESIAPSVNGARRWLRVGVTVQPSDFAKLAVVVWTAAAAVKKQAVLSSLTRGLGPFLAAWTCILAPIMLEPDLSTACLIAFVGAVIAFVAGARIGHFVFLGLLAAPLASKLLNAGYRGSRWESLLLDPGSAPLGSAFQSYQSLVAIGSGGVTGVGFGKGRQKFGFLPEAHNDFIFAMIGEEWGFLGALAVVLAFGAFIVVGFRVARRAKDLFGELLAVGVVSLIGMQAFFHIGVGLGVFPATGLSLPFVSFGRTNMIVLLAAVGILVAVAREAPEGRRERPPERRAAW